MRSDPYDDPFRIDDSEPPPEARPAERPIRKPSRPYGIQPAPAELVRAPGAPMETHESAFTADPGSARGFAEASAASAFADRKSAPADCRSARQAPVAAPASPAPATADSPRPMRPRHEKFCQAYVMLGEAGRAAWEAGYSGGSGHNQAYRLLKRPEIQARIAEIQRGLARGFAADAEALLGKLESVYRHCIEAGRYNAAVRVVEVQARMAGHLKTKAAPPLVAGNDEK